MSLAPPEPGPTETENLERFRLRLTSGTLQPPDPNPAAIAAIRDSAAALRVFRRLAMSLAGACPHIRQTCPSLTGY